MYRSRKGYVFFKVYLTKARNRLDYKAVRYSVFGEASANASVLVALLDWILSSVARSIIAWMLNAPTEKNGLG